MKRLLTVSLVLGSIAAAGCKDSPPPAAKTVAAEGDVAPSGGDEPSKPAKGESEPEVDRKKAIDETLAAVPEIQKQVGELRKLDFKTQVPAEFQSDEDFRTFLVSSIAEELPPEKSAALTRALHRVGLLKGEKRDLASLLTEAMVSQAGAYYDPKQKKFFVVMVSTNTMARNAITAHELTHALQDQHFDLGRYYGMGAKEKLTEDQTNARRFIVEGEATLLMVAQAAKGMMNVNLLEGPAVEQVGVQLKAFADMSIEQLVAMTRDQAATFAGADDGFKKAIEGMDKIPLYILVPLMDAYMKGTLPVYEAFRAAGWDGVAQLYSAPPQSTEQVLHPKTKLIGVRDYPVNLDIKTPAGWTQVHSDVIGELGWRVYFMLWEAADPVASAAGWDGDRIAIYEKGDELVGLVATTWDSVAEATEFEKAYKMTLTKRYPGDAPVQVVRRGADVFAVDGSMDPSLLKHVRGASKTPVRASAGDTILPTKTKTKQVKSAGDGLVALADQACGCKSKKCADKVLDDFVAFALKHKDTPGDTKKANEAGRRIAECLIAKGVKPEVLIEKLKVVQ